MSKKGENIYKRKDNRWEARYVKEHLPDGKIKYGYCYARTYREAKQKAEEARKNLSTKALVDVNKRHSLDYFCDEWLTLNRNRVKESTYVKYQTIIEKHIKPALGGYNLQMITAVTAEQFSDRLLREDGLSAKTVKDILIVLKSVMKYVSKSNPDIRLPEISYPREVKKEMRVLSKQEQERFVRYLINDTDKCKFGVLLALLTGMRIGEICALRWGDISLCDMTVTVSSTMQRLKNLDSGQSGKTKVVIGTPKSASSKRVIPLTGYAAQLCRAYQNVEPSAFVLTGSSQCYIEPRVLQYKLKTYTRECGIEDVHFHVLRHTFATRCVEVGFEIKSLSEILGHSSPTVTLERYVHSSLELKRSNMDKLAAIGF